MTVHQLFSRFANGNAPVRCSYCEERFNGTAYRHNGKYYCSELCRDADQPSVEDFARRVN